MIYPFFSRIIARVLATRLRDWAEKLGILGDTQYGFRSGRSTGDASQIFLKIHEEYRRVLRMGDGDASSPDAPVAVLLDISS